jgi:hypothetical protein
VFYSIVDVLSIIDYNGVSNWSYFVCNGLSIVAYIFLVLYIIKSLNARLVFKRFLLDFIVLLILDVYMIYMLVKLIKPLDFETNYVDVVHLIELLYNLVLILVFSLAFLSYVQNTTKKHLLLFAACVLIAFSELIILGYYYLFEDIRLSYVSTVFYVSGVIALFCHTITPSKVEQRNLNKMTRA